MSARPINGQPFGDIKIRSPLGQVRPTDSLLTGNNRTPRGQNQHDSDQRPVERLTEHEVLFNPWVPAPGLAR